MTHAIKPPLTEATAKACVQADEDAWNARDPKLVARKWRRQLHFRLRSELQSHMAVQTFPNRVPRTHKSKTTR